MLSWPCGRLHSIATYTIAEHSTFTLCLLLFWCGHSVARRWTGLEQNALLYWINRLLCPPIILYLRDIEIIDLFGVNNLNALKQHRKTVHLQGFDCANVKSNWPAVSALNGPTNWYSESSLFLIICCCCNSSPSGQSLFMLQKFNLPCCIIMTHTWTCTNAMQ